MKHTNSNTNTTESIIDSDDEYLYSNSETLVNHSELMVRELLLNIRRFVDRIITDTDIITYPLLYPSRRMYHFLQVTNQYHVECSILFTQNGYIFIENILNNNLYGNLRNDSLMNYLLGLQQRFIEAYIGLYPGVPEVLIESNINEIWGIFLDNLKESNSLDIISDCEGFAFVSLLLMSVPIIQWVSVLDLFGTSLVSDNQLHHIHLIYDVFSSRYSPMAYEVFVPLLKESSLPLWEIHNGFLAPSFQEKVIDSLVQIGNNAVTVAVVTQGACLELALELSANELQELTANSISEMNAIASSQSLSQQLSDAIIWVQGNYITVTLLGGGVIILCTVSTQVLFPGFSQYFTNWLNGNSSSLIRPDITPLQGVRTDAIFTPIPVIEDIATVTPVDNLEIIANVPITLPTSVVIITSVIIAGLLVKKVGIIRLFPFFK